MSDCSCAEAGSSWPGLRAGQPRRAGPHLIIMEPGKQAAVRIRSRSDRIYVEDLEHKTRCSP